MSKPVTVSPLRVVIAGGALIASTALAGAAFARPNAPLAAVSCGQTVTASVTLANDLVNCPGTGLVIGADNITVDLGGHTIAGTNAPKSEGIADNGHAHVTIANGTITGFHVTGVGLHRAPSAVVRRLTVKKIGAAGKKGEASAGILVDHSPSSTISDNTVTNQVRAYQADGVDVLNSGDTRIQRNRLEQNAWNGLVVILSPKTQVSGNHLNGNKNNGMEANVGSDSISVSANEANNNRSWGMVVGAVRQANVLANTMTGNGRTGLFFFDLRDSLIRGNRASGNTDGIELYGGQKGSRHNQLSANSATQNRDAGIWVHGDGPKKGADRNVLAGNDASNNGRGGGILIQGSARANSLLGNRANGNKGHGITAVSGTIDRGENSARRNKRAPQCVGVKCH